MSHGEKFRQRIDDVRSRVLELQNYSIHPMPNLLDELVQDLENALAELDVAEDELRLQGDLLDETRDALFREQERYRQLFDFAPDAYVVTDLYGSILHTNLAAIRLLNSELKFLIRKPLVVFVATEQHAVFRSALLALRDTGSPKTLELLLIPRHKDTPVSVIAMTTMIYEPDGTPSAIHWGLVDITRQKQLEIELRQLNTALEERVKERTITLEEANQQKDLLLQEAQAARAEAERANQLKLKLLATISHELRTPLTSIKGFASTLLAKDVSWEQDRWYSFVSIIDDEANKLAELVEQLLDLSRLQAGALSIQVMPSSFMNAVRQANPQLHVLTNQHQLIVNVPPALPQVAIDQKRIAQVLVNLVGNAVKHSPKGTRIELSARHRHETVEVSIADEGSGIPAEEREQVFEAFYQSDKRITQRAGAGLGLAICKGLIEQHHGKIWIAEQESPGTTVCFTLPVVGEVHTLWEASYYDSEHPLETP